MSEHNTSTLEASEVISTPPNRPEAIANVDALTQSTARMTRPAWDCFLSVRADWQAVCHQRFRFAIECDSPDGAGELASQLDAISVTAIRQEGSILRFLSSFAKLQHVIKHPALRLVDATANFGV